MKNVTTTILAGAMILATATASFGYEGEVGRRQARQQARIGQGVSGGSMTAGETARVEHQEHRLNQEVRADRFANGGNLTNNEKRQINHQENGLSREIYNDKHNAFHQ